MGLLYSKPFTNSYFHFLIAVESATSQALIQQHKEMIHSQKVHVGHTWCGSLKEHLPSIAQIEEVEMAIRE
jgi:hypothetical protein